MPLLFAPFLKSELERLQAEPQPQGKVSDVPQSLFDEAETTFTKLVGEHETYAEILRRAEHLGRAHRAFPADIQWPKLFMLGDVSPEKDRVAVGTKMGKLWTKVYGIDYAVLNQRLQTGLATEALHNFLLVRNSQEALVHEGTVILKAMSELSGSFTERSKSLSWWTEATVALKAKTAAQAARVMLRERPIRLSADECSDRRIVYAGMNLTPVCMRLKDAPPTLWQTAMNEVEQIEESLKGCGIGNLSGPFNTRSFRRERVAGPVSIVFDAMGIRVPAAIDRELLAGVLDRLREDEERGFALSKAAMWLFANHTLSTVAKYGLLIQVMKATQTVFAEGLARCIVDAFIHDYTWLEKMTTTGKPAPKSAAVLFWSAITRGWLVARRLLAPMHVGASSIEFLLLPPAKPVEVGIDEF